MSINSSCIRLLIKSDICSVRYVDNVDERLKEYMNNKHPDWRKCVVEDEEETTELITESDLMTEEETQSDIYTPFQSPHYTPQHTPYSTPFYTPFQTPMPTATPWPYSIDLNYKYNYRDEMIFKLENGVIDMDGLIMSISEEMMYIISFEKRNVGGREGLVLVGNEVRNVDYGEYVLRKVNGEIVLDGNSRYVINNGDELMINGYDECVNVVLRIINVSKIEFRDGKYVGLNVCGGEFRYNWGHNRNWVEFGCEESGVEFMFRNVSKSGRINGIRMASDMIGVCLVDGRIIPADRNDVIFVPMAVDSLFPPVADGVIDRSRVQMRLKGFDIIIDEVSEVYDGTTVHVNSIETRCNITFKKGMIDGVSIPTDIVYDINIDVHNKIVLRSSNSVLKGSRIDSAVYHMCMSGLSRGHSTYSTLCSDGYYNIYGLSDVLVSLSHGTLSNHDVLVIHKPINASGEIIACTPNGIEIIYTDCNVFTKVVEDNLLNVSVPWGKKYVLGDFDVLDEPVVDEPTRPPTTTVSMNGILDSRLDIVFYEPDLAVHLIGPHWIETIINTDNVFSKQTIMFKDDFNEDDWYWYDIFDLVKDEIYEISVKDGNIVLKDMKDNVKFNDRKIRTEFGAVRFNLNVTGISSGKVTSDVTSDLYTINGEEICSSPPIEYTIYNPIKVKTLSGDTKTIGCPPSGIEIEFREYYNYSVTGKLYPNNTLIPDTWSGDVIEFNEFEVIESPFVEEPVRPNARVELSSSVQTELYHTTDTHEQCPSTLDLPNDVRFDKYTIHRNLLKEPETVKFTAGATIRRNDGSQSSIQEGLEYKVSSEGRKLVLANGTTRHESESYEEERKVIDPSICALPPPNNQECRQFDNDRDGCINYSPDGINYCNYNPGSMSYEYDCTNPYVDTGSSTYTFSVDKIESGIIENGKGVLMIGKDKVVELEEGSKFRIFGGIDIGNRVIKVPEYCEVSFKVDMDKCIEIEFINNKFRCKVYGDMGVNWYNYNEYVEFIEFNVVEGEHVTFSYSQKEVAAKVTPGVDEAIINMCSPYISIDGIYFNPGEYEKFGRDELIFSGDFHCEFKDLTRPPNECFPDISVPLQYVSDLKFWSDHRNNVLLIADGANRFIENVCTVRGKIEYAIFKIYGGNDDGYISHCRLRRGGSSTFIVECCLFTDKGIIYNERHSQITITYYNDGTYNDNGNYYECCGLRFSNFECFNI